MQEAKAKESHWERPKIADHEAGNEDPLLQREKLVREESRNKHVREERVV